MVQSGMHFAKGLGNHLARLSEVFGGIHQVAGRLHGHGPADIRHDASHGTGMIKGLFTGRQALMRQQGFGKRR